MRNLGTSDLDVLELLFEQLPDSPFFVKDRELRYVAANGAMARLCGVEGPHLLYGRRARDFFPPGLSERYEALDREIIERNRALTNILDRSVEAGGGSAWLLFARVPVRASDGSCIGVAATSRRLRPGLVSEASYAKLRTVTERLRSRFDQPLELAALAGLAGLSPSQLERDFRRVFGMSPRTFLQSVRHQEACRRLDETDASIAAISHECGYADHSAFTRRFRRLTGRTPKEYRLRGGSAR